MLNAAFCGFYARHCGVVSPRDECPAETAGIDAALRICKDEHEACPKFARRGECLKNPAWMMGSCARSCGMCRVAQREQIRTLLGVQAPPPLRPPRYPSHTPPNPPTSPCYSVQVQEGLYLGSPRAPLLLRPEVAA